MFGLGIFVVDIEFLTGEFPSRELLSGGDTPRDTIWGDALPLYVGILVGVADCRVGAELVERRGAVIGGEGSGVDIVEVFVLKEVLLFLAGEALVLAGEAPVLAGEALVLAGDALVLAGDALPLSVALVVAFVVVLLVVGFEVALAVDDFIRNANG